MSREGSKTRRPRIADMLLLVAAVTAAMVLYQRAIIPARIAANEREAISRLAMLAHGQVKWSTLGPVDQDGDLNSEFGFWQEVGAKLPPRGSTTLGTPTRPVWNMVDGVGRHDGYHYQYHLPDGRGGWIAESAVLPSPDPVAADAQECMFLIYAWPVVLGVTGNRAFVAGPSQEVLATENRGYQHYGGAQAPPSNAAVVGPDRKEGGLLMPGVPTQDGGLWFWAE